MATTYNNLFLDTRARLKKAGIDSAQLEAREILCYAANKTREQFYRDMALYVSGELERRVDTDMAVAFSMYPTSIGELFAVADAGRLMPPKSTWFEPKLRSGLFLHALS